MMRNGLLAIAALGSFAGLAAVSASAQGPNSWRGLGAKTVDGRDTDTIDLPGDRRFRQIRLCAFNAPLRMRDLEVYFANGRKQEVEVRKRINPGTCTRNIDLQGERRDISSIRLRYEPILQGMGKPLIRVQGR